MPRDNTIVLSDEEKELVVETKRTLYGEDSIPHGHVIGTALRRTLNDIRGGTSKANGGNQDESRV